MASRMTDRPIIFSGPMVRALLEGRKTQTRRLATSPLSRAVVGDRLWVRENFHPWKGSASGKTIVYVADDRWIDWGSGETFIDKVQWLTSMTPSIHMPRWASRLTLTVTRFQLQHLHEITEADAIAEGVTDEMVGKAVTELDNPLPDSPWVGGYAWLWSSLHGRASWDENPMVVAVEFEVEQVNVASGLAPAS